MTLQEWMDREGLVDATAALALGVARPTINRLRHGQRAPSAALMQQIAEATKGAVMPNDWLTSDRSHQAIAATL